MSKPCSADMVGVRVILGGVCIFILLTFFISCGRVNQTIISTALVGYKNNSFRLAPVET